MKLAQMMQAIADHRARVKALPPAPKPKAAARLLPILLGVSSASARKRLDAALRAAPQDEVLSTARPHPEERSAGPRLEGWAAC